jgi:putative ABC transport system substrate-binding protein
MRRRAFLGGSMAVLAASAVDAQPAANLPRVGLLTISGASNPQLQRNLEAIRQGLRERGWIEGKNIVIETRYAEGNYDKLPALTADLLRARVAVIVGSTTPLVRIIQEQTRTTPVVMVAILDPVEAGFAGSLARPGGNITGLTLIAGPEIVGKQIELLKQTVPSVSRVAVLANPNNGAHEALWKEAARACRALQLRATRFDARGAKELDPAFAAMNKHHADALLILIDAALLAVSRRLAELATSHRLPTMSGVRAHTENGGLVSYGADLTDQWRRAAGYVDRVLKGAKPAEMPIEQPSKFELVVNSRTAKALGLTIPPALLLRADEVIE